MKEVKKLYPLRFTPIAFQNIWGGNNFMISDLGVVDSVVSEGWLEGNTITDVLETYIERIIGEKVYHFYGRQLPIQVKSLDIQDSISVQVSPNDEIAAERYDSLGKAKLWYINQAEPGSKIYLGLKKTVTAQELYKRCLDGSIVEALNVIEPKKGDSFVIMPGTIHSAKGGLKITEITESSELNLRLYDWGRENDSSTEREIHLEEAIDLINFNEYSDNSHYHNPDSGKTLVDIPELTVNKFTLSDTLHIYPENYSSFIIYTCIEGKFEIEVATEKYLINPGDSILIPAELSDFYLRPLEKDSVVLESYMKIEEELDNYIDPSTEAFLEGEDYDGVEDEEETSKDSWSEWGNVEVKKPF